MKKKKQKTKVRNKTNFNPYIITRIICTDANLLYFYLIYTVLLKKNYPSLQFEYFNALYLGVLIFFYVEWIYLLSKLLGSFVRCKTVLITKFKSPPSKMNQN